MKVYVVVDSASGYDNLTYDPVSNIEVFNNMDDAKEYFKTRVAKYSLESPDDGEQYLDETINYFSVVNHEEDYSANVEIIPKVVKEK